MTEEQVRATIGSLLQELIPTIAWIGNVPYVTGRLHSSIKLQPTATGYDIIIDTGNISLEDWEELQRTIGIQTQPMGFAPYAGKVNSRNPYWRRVAMAVYDRLKIALGDNGPTRYDANISARGGNNE